MKRTISLIVGSLCLAALPVSSMETIETINTAAANTATTTNATQFMQEFWMHRRGKMQPFSEFMERHQELRLEDSSSQVAFTDNNDRDLQLSGARIPREDYCKDLTLVEQFLERSFLAAYDDLNMKLTLTYQCNCTTTGINWKLSCGADYYGNKAYYGTNIETAIFSLGGDGLYRMVEASWGDSEYGDEDVPQETYYMTNGNGTLTGCEGNGCSQCTICDSGAFVAMDCPLTGEALNYSVSCDDGYMGSFLSQYYFGPISENSTSSVLGTYQSHIEFCSNLTHLETFMDQYFTDIFFASDANTNVSFACRCNEEDINLYLKCTAPYTYLGVSGVSRDSAHFEARNGVYELIKTSWGDSHFGGSIEDDQEEFFYQNGRLIGCRYADCLSCRICTDGKSARCEDIALGDDNCYEPGAFASVYDFGTIVVGVLDTNRDFGGRPRVSGAVSNGRSIMGLVLSTLLFTAALALW